MRSEWLYIRLIVSSLPWPLFLMMESMNREICAARRCTFFQLGRTFERFFHNAWKRLRILKGAFLRTIVYILNVLFMIHRQQWWDKSNRIGRWWEINPEKNCQCKENWWKIMKNGVAVDFVSDLKTVATRKGDKDRDIWNRWDNENEHRSGNHVLIKKECTNELWAR